MNDLETWIVERFVDLENETFWHEVGRVNRSSFHTDAKMLGLCQTIGFRHAARHGARYRVRRIVEVTEFESN